MPLRFVAIGDSTVEGLEDPGPDGSYVGWADRLAAHLDAAHPGLLYANLAVRGETTDEVRRTQLQPAVAMAPDIAVVVAGVNNVLRPRPAFPCAVLPQSTKLQSSCAIWRCRLQPI